MILAIPGQVSANRHRLDRGGNRQSNAAILRVAVTRPRCHRATRAYIARK
jgi:transposase